jgi:hypothetical protein
MNLVVTAASAKPLCACMGADLYLKQQALSFIASL